MKGETVTVIRRSVAGTDPFGAPAYTETSEDVDDVLVMPGGMSNTTDSVRAHGTEVAFTLCFPRAWTYSSLKGTLIRLTTGGVSHDYRVVGDPRPVDGGMTPTRWNMSVDITDTEG